MSWPVGAGTFPWTTLGVNLLGSIALGVILTVAVADSVAAHRTRAFVAVGFCGGFTTFSTWMVESVLLARDGDVARGALYTVVSIVAGLAAVTLGVVGVRVVAHRQIPRFDPQDED